MKGVRRREGEREREGMRGGAHLFKRNLCTRSALDIGLGDGGALHENEEGGRIISMMEGRC
jgi:hypothetical protein